ncbi:MAG: hydrogenase formation protein HypD [Deltaproteobacteria bacterium]|nr:hydrogenase formation protein HypD [Deltaproteobacteria bacterium]
MSHESANATLALAEEIHQQTTHMGSTRIMEVCGTHTVSLFRSGVKSMLPENVRLISGPGCPVCVTAQGYIDAASELCSKKGVTIATYGDMVRVPGRGGSLAEARARGGNVKVVYSARDAVEHASTHPEETVVFLAVGFETTAPATALAVLEAEARGLENFLILPGHKLVIPAMEALLAGEEVPLDGFLCPGHVSVIIGSEAYRPIVADHHRSCVVTGFEPKNMLQGLLRLLQILSGSEPELDNVYSVAVRPKGNTQALSIIERVFKLDDATWRAMGVIPKSGLALRETYARFDALKRFDGLDVNDDYDPPGCRCGEVIQGKVEPADCALFGASCTPMKPVGPCMVSSEGTCAAWYKYGRR